MHHNSQICLRPLELDLDCIKLNGRGPWTVKGLQLDVWMKKPRHWYSGHPSATNSRSQFADQLSQIFCCKNLSYKMKFDIRWSKRHCSPIPSHLWKLLWVFISVDLRPNSTDMVLLGRKIGLGSFKGVCQSSFVKHIAIWISLSCARSLSLYI